jgi:hypothetical protein
MCDRMNTITVLRSSVEFGNTRLLGLAHLMTIAFEGADLKSLADQMIARATADEQDANAWMDLSTILFLQGARDVGLAAQTQALQISQAYELLPSRTPALRLLALMAPGDLMTNTPLPFLIENSDIALSMLYLLPEEPLPGELPPHDVLYVAISLSEATQPLLEQLELHSDAWPNRALNRPARIASTGRESAYQLLAECPQVWMVPTVRVTRTQLSELAQGVLPVRELLAEGRLPLIVRPLDSHAGNGLEKIESLAELAVYLDSRQEPDFFISRFVDYRSADGLYRKFRVVLVGSKAFAAHMGVSGHWMVHYLNAGMTDSESKRAEEAHFMEHFQNDFGRRHALGLSEIAQRFGLDYLVIDCAETPQGELLVFEVDPGAVVHSMDSVAMFPYKVAPMQNIYAAFRSMLLNPAARAQ